jgi:hypothetical protein
MTEDELPISYQVTVDGTLLLKFVVDGQTIILTLKTALLPELKRAVERAMNNAAADDTAMCPDCQRGTVRKFDNGAVMCWVCGWSPR